MISYFNVKDYFTDELEFKAFVHRGPRFLAPQQQRNKEESRTLSCLMICSELNRLSGSMQREWPPLKFERVIEQDKRKLSGWKAAMRRG